MERGRIERERTSFCSVRVIFASECVPAPPFLHFPKHPTWKRPLLNSSSPKSDHSVTSLSMRDQTEVTRMKRMIIKDELSRSLNDFFQLFALRIIWHSMRRAWILISRLDLQCLIGNSAA